MTTSKVLRFFFAFFLLVLTVNGLKAQQNDCNNLVDPLLNYEPEFDPCCKGIEYGYGSVCYDLAYLDSLWGPLSQPNPYSIISFIHPPQDTFFADYPPGYLVFTNFDTLANLLDTVCAQAGIATDFIWNDSTGMLCATDLTSLEFGDLTLCYHTTGCTPEPISPIITQECPFDTEPLANMVNDLMEPDSATVPNVTIFSGDWGSITTDDVVNGEINNPADTVPTGTDAAIILNGLVQSGALEYGMGCFNLNCIDLDSLAGEMANNAYVLDALDTLTSPPGNYNSMEEFLDDMKDSIQVQFQNEIIGPYGNLTNYVNATLGLNIPDQGACGDTLLPIMPGEKSKKGGKGGFDKDWGGDPGKTEADQDYFSQTIPGIGLEGPGAAQPSPSALEQIKQISGGVNLYNGSQSTSIPLYTLVGNDISVPISISSSNNGLKVNDLGSVVGQHWNLNAGGMISRVVKGLPDEFDGQTTSVGVGRNMVPTPRVEILSNAGLDILLIPDPQCPVSLGQEINTGFTIFKTPSTDAPPVIFKGQWSPLNLTLVNFTVSIKVYEFLNFNFYLSFGFNGGFALNQQLQEIEYVEEGLGFFHLNDHDKMDAFGLDTLSHPMNLNLDTLQQKAIFEKIHAQRRINDVNFFSDHMASWEAWINWIQNDFSITTQKIDTEPDEFHFNFGGYSGKFMFNLNDTPVIFPAQDLDIDVKYTADEKHIAEFSITTPEGMRYTFGDSTNLKAVDISKDTSFYLPNFYTYPEEDLSRSRFGQAQIDMAQIVHQPLFGRNRIITYGNTYNRNYRVSEQPEFSSAWHLLKIESLLTNEEVTFDYSAQEDLTFYSNKSYSHTIPNFSVDSTKLVTDANADLNPFHIKKTKWENGQAELAYTATQTTLKRWDLTEIANTRGEKVNFLYQTDREEIVGDHLCSRINVNRDNQLYKGWLLDYGAQEVTDTDTDCDAEYELIGRSPISVSDDYSFYLGQPYSLNFFEHNAYFFFNINILNCVTIPIRITDPYAVIFKTDFGYRTHLSEFGSLMEVKGLRGVYYEDREEAIWNAEKKRSFLSGIREIGRNNDIYDEFIDTIQYKGTAEELKSIPKRFHYNQDLFGYYNNNTTGSPFPKLKYTGITNGETVSTGNQAIKNHFGFYVEGISSPVSLGHKEEGEFEFGSIGALSFLKYGSGGSIQYEYEANVLPDNTKGAGLRIKRLIEDPIDMPAKVTSYSYDTATIVNEPIRISQNPYNFYYRESGQSQLEHLEEKVIITSSPQNPLVSNKGNYVGYHIVTESWNEGEDNVDVGSIKHYFFTPKPVLDSLGSSSGITQNSFRTRKFGSPPSPTNYHDLLNGETPPELQYVDIDDWWLGLEYKTEVFDAAGGMRQQSNREYITFSPPQIADYLIYSKSLMYQHNYPGSFGELFTHRQIKNYLPFNIIPGGALIEYFIDVYTGLSPIHPYKRIDRYYYYYDARLESSNVALAKDSTINFFVDGSSNWVRSENTYLNTPNNPRLPIPKTTKTTYSDNIETLQVNHFVYDESQALDLFDQDAVSYLDSIGYGKAVATTNFLGSNLVNSSITTLKKEAGRIVPQFNWVSKNGDLQLAGQFTAYDTNGKPTTHRLAKYGADTDDPLTGDYFFDPINLTWNNRLQLTSRTYLGFSTSYIYNDYFELFSETNPDTIVTAYFYDSRGRLKTQYALNNRQITSYTYNIEPENNWTQTKLSFADGSFPDQKTTQFTDGLGKPLRTIRENDGAQLNSFLYDSYFRKIAETNITSGQTTYEFDASPITRKTISIDAVGNLTISVNTGDNNYFAATHVTDPNGHTSFTYTDGLGRTRKTVSPSPLNSTTQYIYDYLSRLSKIINPIGEVFEYKYNDIDKVYYKKFPGKEAHKFWWDIAFRPRVTKDGKGNVLYTEYDDYNRITQVYLADQGESPAMGAIVIVPEDTFVNVLDDEYLLKNFYEDGHTWIDTTEERVITASGLGDWKSTHHLGIDDIGRPATVKAIYPSGTLTSIPTYTDANITTDETVTINGPQGMLAEYEYTFDNILRPSKTELSVNESALEPIAQLIYNDQDLVKTKFLGDKLQKVDYLYDASGRLTHINTPAEMECYLNDSICLFEVTFYVDLTENWGNDSTACRTVSGVNINGNFFGFKTAIDLLDPSESALLGTYIEEALDYYGLNGEVTVLVTPGVSQFTFYVSVSQSNASSIELIFSDCRESVNLLPTDCCQREPSGGWAEQSVPQGLFSPNDDLYYEEISYIGLDINRIEIGSDCSVGKMRNDYQYDANHRVINMANTVFTPDPVHGRYNTSYRYDSTGNMLNLNRSGLIDTTGGVFSYGGIDSLSYIYGFDDSRLTKLYDLVSDPQAIVQGYEGVVDTTQAGIYSYDGNGNMISDAEQGLSLEYSFLNLPRWVISGTDSILFEYTFGGEKIRKLTIAGGNTDDRLYLGGAEYLNDTLELFHHPEGRVIWRDTTPSFQYRIGDHLGNTVVFFEDKNGDGLIFSELVSTNPDSLEVWQRQYYYPFGMEMEGPWNRLSSPRMDHLYNGKELEEELGWNWYAYGFRYYDAVTGRFTGVDPLAAKFPGWSPYVFTMNNPINLIDPDGREPIKPFAGTVSGFMTFFNRLSSGIGASKGSTAHAAMIRMGSVNWKNGLPSPAATAPFNTAKINESDKTGNRYIYTKKGGWVDMSHFMFYAGRAYRAKLDKQQASEQIKAPSFGMMREGAQMMLIERALKDPIGEALQEGYMQEMMDQYGPTYSAYSYEDLPSDKFGADFSVNFFDPNSELTFSEQLQNYLNNVLEATSPQDAPNYKNLPTKYPEKGELPSVQNRTTQPMFIKE